MAKLTRHRSDADRTREIIELAENEARGDDCIAVSVTIVKENGLQLFAQTYESENAKSLLALMLRSNANRLDTQHFGPPPVTPPGVPPVDPT